MSQIKPFTTSAEVFAWIEQTHDHKIKPGLKRMEWLLDRLDHPERRCKFIHIAGTNGKGSTSAMLSSVLRAAGYPTGLFISPYITHWSERIQFDGEPIAESSFVHWANVLLPHVEAMREETELGALSPFEWWTIVAICYFALEACPWFIVWETGLGGRLDSTNVVYPLVSVITQVGLDHQEWLGESIAEIAREKAGIIKPGVPVVCGAEDPTALTVITERAKEMKSQLYTLHRDYDTEKVSADSAGQRFHFTNVYRTLSNLETQLVGDHQLRNAATALMTLEVLRQNYATVLDVEQIVQGLQQAHWPGRLEKMGEHPQIVLDGAHNPDGIQALASALSLYSYDRLFLLIGMMKDKEIEGLQALLALANHVTTTTVTGQLRSLPAEELAERLRKMRPELTIETSINASAGLQEMKKRATERDLLLVTGSLYLVSEVRPLLIQERAE